MSGGTEHSALQLVKMWQLTRLRNIIAADPLRMQALEMVAALDLPDCWIAAGFVRDAVWDDLHGYDVRLPLGDIDVVWFDAAREDARLDRQWEALCQDNMPQLSWSVKNQARMHQRNGDAPYMSVSDAMTHWPETATAVAVRLDEGGSIIVNAPFGLDDLFALRLHPAPHFTGDKAAIFKERVAAKKWLNRYPKLTLLV